MPTEQTDTTQNPPEEITYTPTVWADGEDGGTPINAANMNNIEEAIVALVERTTKQVVTSMIADGAVTKDKLEKTLGDSLSRQSRLLMSDNVRASVGRSDSGAFIIFKDDAGTNFVGLSVNRSGTVTSQAY